MEGKASGALLLVMVLLGILVAWLGFAAPAGAATSAEAEDGQPPGLRREREGDPAAPTISFIESPGGTCYRPEPHTDTCFINWTYLSVAATPPNYVISMTLTIDGRRVSTNWGFFQTSMYIPGDFYADGFRVACGVPGSAGVPALGRTHSFVVRARETGGLGAANYGSITCPSGLAWVHLPVVLRR